MKKNKANMLRAYISMFGLVAITGFLAFYSGLVTTHYVIETEKLDSKQSFRIVLLADLHSHIFGGDQTSLAHKILAQHPDAVLLAGDMIDNRKPMDGVRLLLAKLEGRTPLYYVTGNHEYWTRNMDKVFELLREYGVVILDDRWEKVALNGVSVILAGVSDPVRADFERGYDPHEAMKKGFANLPTDTFSILLAHRPNWISEYQKYPFDLVLSGHNHGGQVRLPPVLNGFIGPDEGLLPKYPGGVYQHGALTQIVSRGLSNTTTIPRVFNPPELVVVDICGKKART